MRTTLNKKDILEVIQLCKGFVEKKGYLPILQCILIRAEENKLVFTSTNMERFVKVSIDAEIEGKWAIAVNANVFNDMVDSVDLNEFTMEIKEDITQLHISTEFKDFMIKGIQADEFVAEPEFDVKERTLMSTKVLSDGFNRVSYAITEKNFSPTFTGVLMRCAGKHLAFVGTDSFRLAEYKIKTRIKKEFDVIVPKVSVVPTNKVANYFCKKDENNKCVMLIGERLVRFLFSSEGIDVEVTALLIQWNFPEYDNDRIIPREFNTVMDGDSKAFNRAILNVNKLTKNYGNYFCLWINGSAVTVKSNETDLGDMVIKLNAEKEWDDITLWINGKHMRDFIKNIKNKKFKLSLVDKSSPMVLTCEDIEGLRYVIRPIDK